MQFMLMLRALNRHRTIVAVLMLEFAVTLAILSNALSLATLRIQTLRTPSGLRESGLLIAAPAAVGSVMLRLEGGAYDDLRNLAASFPGVQSASILGVVPLSGADRWHGSLSAIPGAVNAANALDVSVYTGDRQAFPTLGLTISAGRWFAPEEILPATTNPELSDMHLVIITKDLGKKLFNTRNPLGNTLYFYGRPLTVVGIATNLSRPSYYGGNKDQDSVFLPMATPYFFGPALAVRMRDDWHGSEQTLLKSLAAALNRRTAGAATWTVQSYGEMRSNLFIADRAALGLLAVILVAVMGVAANGIAASSGYWVHQRARQTWIRRAVGATRSQTVRYYLLENAVICGIGVLLGVGLGVTVNLALIHFLSVARVTVESLIAGAVLAFLIGQLAVLRSALKSVTV